MGNKKVKAMRKLVNATRSCRSRRGQRKGVVAVLMALLAVPLMGMAAFSVDMAWIAAAESRLQGAADAAALAGTEQLSVNFNSYNSSPQSGQAAIITRTEATRQDLCQELRQLYRP